MSSDEAQVKVEGLSKKFCRSLGRSLWYGLCDISSELLPSHRSRNSVSELREAEFWAVKDVSFELRRGDCLALLGHNGAGKTTLLKLLNGLIKPDEGKVTVRGRVGALIALGAGFNPILTGRENLYVNGAVLGIKKDEIDTKFDEIVEFSGVGEFIDSPVQSYSSGMQVRLGFAIATAIKPDVLILDEVLAVGDGDFRAKCYSRIGEMMKDAAVILVSHDLNSVGQACNLGLVLDRGRSVSQKLLAIDRALNAYCDMSDRSGTSLGAWPEHRSFPLTRGTAKLDRSQINYGEHVRVDFTCELSEPVMDPVIRATIFSHNNEAVAEWNSLAQCVQTQFYAGVNHVSLEFGPIMLRAGRYEIAFLVADSTGLRMLYLWHRGLPLTLAGQPFGQSSVQLAGKLSMRVE